MWNGAWMITELIELIEQIGIIVLVVLYIKTHQKGVPEIEKTKFETTAKNWVLAVLANLAAGLILLLVGKLIG